MNQPKRYFRTGEGITGMILLALLVLAALAAPLVFPGDPLSIVATPLLQPFESSQFLFGTDRLGRDVIAELFYGARTSLGVGLAAALASIVLGSIVGTLAGFAGGIIDEVLMRITEAFQTVPGFLLALALTSIAGPSLPVLIAAIALSSWTQAARLTRGQVLSIRESDYVASARVIGMHPMEIAFRQILPNALPPVLALAPVIVASAILIEAALSFLGLGDPNRVTWGGMIAEGRTVLRSAPWLSILPGLALAMTVVGVYLAGEGLTNAIFRREVLS
ncbi:ABC transporter permease [Brucella sp. ZJ1_1]|uniref:Binding-protein-dependent transport systems inner membrane component n=3 Tax=Brucella intermedia TaxID=94625 RepID=C4WNL4_9HYPH|nr:ABC transporter permease [Brucella intermedia]ERI13615.1 peptide ABC transporter permease [Ochrobactrum sp. EGD-AQ16]EEQ93969.1 binding-protein-dependent transport systems inner membrane component [Brucella intermedia LMG 3301]ELT50764.1 binding-protein-dependent transport system inner membrane protein [Brucella intermedia M86]KAB2694453.1 ABC transporter permease [Brucella intermedia]MDH0125519.1 ABC transporter permease [Brucella intermedia GD04153]